MAVIPFRRTEETANRSQPPDETIAARLRRAGVNLIRDRETPTPQENDMTFVPASPTVDPSPLRELAKTLREKGADRFHAALAAVLAAGLERALEEGDHPKAISFINRGFAEGSPQLGCDLLCRAIAVVGTARTWTVQLAPLSSVRQRPAPQGDDHRCQV